VLCYIFNAILKHVHRTKPDDGRDDYDYGRYWNKHRELDNMLSGAFMFLPERFRLPKNLRDPAAVYTNLNLHASVICLHNSAYEMTKEHDLPDHVKKTSKTRVLTAAQEIVTVVKLTSHSNVGYKSPLVALALYVASSVYTTMSQDDGPQPDYTANLEFLLVAMHAIGKQHVITRSFLTQAIVDLQRAGIIGIIRIPRVEMPETSQVVTECGNNIPLFARSRLSRIEDMQPPLPGKLPLGNPTKPGDVEKSIRQVLQGELQMPYWRGGEQDAGNANKRKRVAVSPEPALAPQDFTPSLWFQPTQAVELTPSDTTTGGSWLSSDDKSPAGAGSAAAAQFRLPHRSGSSAGTSPSAVANSASTPPTQPSSGVSSGTTGPNAGGSQAQGQGQVQTGIATASTVGTTPGVLGPLETTDSSAAEQQQQQQQVYMAFFQGMSGWEGAGDPAALFSQMVASMQGGVGNLSEFAPALDDDSWMMIGDGGSGAADAPWDTGQGGTGGVG
jgi:hypothetical protein